MSRAATGLSGIEYHLDMADSSGIVIEKRQRDLDPDVERRLIAELGRCPDLAFAHLPQVFVPGRQDQAELVLFAWLQPEALGSLRFALNLVTEAVSRALPSDQFLDVVVLNSAPELLEQIERAGCLLVERNAEERSRALAAAAQADTSPDMPSKPWWWPF